MPITEIERTETYNAQTGEVTIEEREIEVKTNEELVTEKQEELIKIYAELQALMAIQP
jgi:hypothetical protein